MKIYLEQPIDKIYAQRCLFMGRDTRVENIGSSPDGSVWFFTYVILRKDMYETMSYYTNFKPFTDAELPVGNRWYHTHHAKDFKGMVKNDIK